MAEKEVASSMDASSSENEGIYLTAQCTTEEAVSTAGHLDEEKRTPNVLSSCNDNISSLEIATSPVNAVQEISSGIQNFDSIAAYQRRQPIEVWKYKEVC